MRLYDTVATFSCAVFSIARTLIYGIDIPGNAALLVAILFFGSLQLISIGMLGEYIGSTWKPRIDLFI
jgi:polyisoprenyl-phosphate glycosyltransferase